MPADDFSIGPLCRHFLEHHDYILKKVLKSGINYLDQF